MTEAATPEQVNLVKEAQAVRVWPAAVVKAAAEALRECEAGGALPAGKMIVENHE